MKKFIAKITPTWVVLKVSLPMFAVAFLGNAGIGRINNALWEGVNRSKFETLID